MASAHSLDESTNTLYENKAAGPRTGAMEKAEISNDGQADLEKAEEAGQGVPKSQLSTTSKILLFIGLVLAVFLGSLDGTIVSTCLPVIASTFNAFDSITWVAVSYLLTFNALQPLYGKFSDIFGHTMLFAICSFLIGSAGCGAATSSLMLIIFRAMAGMGGAGLFGLVFIIIADIFPLEERPRYQAIIGSSFGFSSVFGPLLGGAFYINLPIGAITILAVVLFLNLPYDRSSLIEKLKRVDFAGTLVLIAAVICILLPITWGGETYAWSSPIEISLFIVAVILLGLFVIVEWKFAREPIMPLRLFKNRSIVAVFITQFFVGMAFFGYIFYLPIFFQVVRGATPTLAGLQLLPMMLGLVIIGNIAGGFMQTIQKRLPPTFAAHVLYIYVGNAFFVLGAGLTSTLDENTSSGITVVYLLLIGIGLGLTLQMNVYAAQSAAEIQDMAVATSMASFFQSIGGSIGIAIFGALEQNALITHLSQIPSSILPPSQMLEVIESSTAIYNILTPDARVAVIHAYVQALHIIFLAAIPFAGAGFIAALFISRKRKQTEGEGEIVAHAAAI
ncbi:major facilitator superfamily domain-containing protein [Endogone sp. FLAS-F59071]|nr:major facilitator superfamily domain-containing protein [Endogone sp. FLAS-F59071]|eukprot:RUS17289.1 major facilitator superfamily domain-containing protein [Endogone sp. FLAS-F59071]